MQTTRPLPVLKDIIPDQIFERLNIIKEIAINLFTQQNNKAPSDLLTNELNNTFLHTHYGAYIIGSLKLKSKTHMRRYMEQLASMNQEQSSLYLIRWDAYEKQIIDNGSSQQFLMQLQDMIVQKTKKKLTLAEKKNMILSLMCYVRLQAQNSELKSFKDIWKYIYGEKFPTRLSLNPKQRSQKCFKKAPALAQEMEQSDSEIETPIQKMVCLQENQSLENQTLSFQNQEENSISSISIDDLPDSFLYPNSSDIEIYLNSSNDPEQFMKSWIYEQI